MNDNTERQQPSRKQILCLDFDGVIHSYVTPGYNAKFVPDPPVEGAIPFIVEAVKDFEVDVFSSRSNEPGGIAAMQGWLEFHMTKELGREVASAVFKQIKWPQKKPPAFLTIDDRALTFDGNWPSVKSLIDFKPWNRT